MRWGVVRWGEMGVGWGWGGLGGSCLGGCCLDCPFLSSDACCSVWLQSMSIPPSSLPPMGGSTIFELLGPDSWSQVGRPSMPIQLQPTRLAPRQVL